jgi:hypothetical protein
MAARNRYHFPALAFVIYSILSSVRIQIWQITAVDMKHILREYLPIMQDLRTQNMLFPEPGVHT